LRRALTRSRSDSPDGLPAVTARCATLAAIAARLVGDHVSGSPSASNDRAISQPSLSSESRGGPFPAAPRRRDAPPRGRPVCRGFAARCAAPGRSGAAGPVRTSRSGPAGVATCAAGPVRASRSAPAGAATCPDAGRRLCASRSAPVGSVSVCASLIARRFQTRLSVSRSYTKGNSAPDLAKIASRSLTTKRPRRCVPPR